VVGRLCILRVSYFCSNIKWWWRLRQDYVDRSARRCVRDLESRSVRISGSCVDAQLVISKVEAAGNGSRLKRGRLGGEEKTGAYLWHA